MDTKPEHKYFDPDSLLGFLNLRHSKIYSAKNPLNRPKYPPTNPAPTTLQVVQNMNLSDLGLAAFLYVTFSAFAYAAVTIMISDAPVKIDRTQFLILKMQSNRAVKWPMLSMIPVLCFLQSYLRLSGQVYNGQDWQFKQNRFQIFSNAPVAKMANALDK